MMVEQMNFNAGGDVLVLNSDGLPLSMLPISTVNWKEAIKAYWLDQVDVLESYEDWVIRSPSVEMFVPAVIMTRQWVRMGRSVKFSRSNVYMRDRHKCQYCGEIFRHDQLTLDHVVPRFQGGKTTWDNVVAACSPCNHKKSHFNEMKPMNAPRRPSYGEMLNIVRERPVVIRHASWNTYLQWPEDMVKVAGK